MSYIDIVFDGPPGPGSGRFIEVEDPYGCSVQVGEWIDRGDGTWALRLTEHAAALAEARREAVQACVKAARERLDHYGLIGSVSVSVLAATERGAGEATP